LRQEFPGRPRHRPPPRRWR